MQWLFICFLELVSIYLTFYYDPGNGCKRGYLGPGGISDNSENYDCIGGAATAIDKLILGESRMYRYVNVRKSTILNHFIDGLRHDQYITPKNFILPILEFHLTQKEY